MRVGMIALGGGQATNIGKESTDVLDARSGKTRFQAKGLKSDSNFHEKIRQHELHHANDHWRAAKATLVPWDMGLQEQLGGRQVKRGDTPKEAQDAVFEDAGGSVEDVVAQMDRLWVELDKAFHESTDRRRSDVQQYKIEDRGAKATGWYNY